MSRARLIDVLAAAATATVVTVAAFAATEPATEVSAVAAYLLGVVLGGLLLARRQRPVTVLVVSAATVMGYNLAGFPGISPIWCLVVPLYTAARHGRLRAGVAVGGSVQLLSAAWVLGAGDRSIGLLDGVVRETVVLALGLTAGVALRNRELFAQEVVARLAAERDRRDRAMRLRMARDLHDVTAHTVTVVGLQVDLARALVDTDPAAARDLLDSTRRINADAVGELQAALRLLRDDGAGNPPELSPAPDHTRIPALLDRAAENGLRVDFTERGRPRPLPPAVGLTLYRIAQESVTNVLRHSGAAGVRAVLTYGDTGVALEVTDDGGGTDAGDPAEGFGLTGMRERAESLGGHLTAGAAPAAGFTVRAWLPLTEPHERAGR